MAETTCPQCGARSDGSFCPACGARLAPAACAACGATPPAGARFCATCGRRLPGPIRFHPAAALAAVGALALLAALFWPTSDGAAAGGPGSQSPSGVAQPGAPQPTGGAGALGSPNAGPPALSADMRTNADGLFDRIMRELSAGDSARARFFVPMALDAYRSSGPLDADGLFHVSLIQAIDGDFAGARATAEAILADDPNHLLGLAAGAAAAEGAGDTDGARAYYQRFLDALPSERDRDLAEYRDHARVIPDYEAAARSALGG